MKQLLIGNWKMNMQRDASLELAFQLKKRLKKITQLEVVVSPSFPYLHEVNSLLAKSHIKLAGQTVASQDNGSYTGEVSATMLKELGCAYAIVGHSERRHKMGETDEMINKKINQCYHAGLIPVLCIGETYEQKKNGQSDSVLVRQLQYALSKVDGLPENKLVVAYEPVWAIGTGTYMDPAEVSVFQRTIKRTLSSLYSEKFYDSNVRFLYGGSVNSINAKGFWVAEYIDGMLVGGGSLDPEEFYNIAFQGE
jgi:triosephosphate isomerase (TIM)